MNYSCRRNVANTVHPLIRIACGTGHEQAGWDSHVEAQVWAVGLENGPVHDGDEEGEECKGDLPLSRPHFHEPTGGRQLRELGQYRVGSSERHHGADTCVRMAGDAESRSDVQKHALRPSLNCSSRAAGRVRRTWPYGTGEVDEGRGVVQRVAGRSGDGPFAADVAGGDDEPGHVLRHEDDGPTLPSERHRSHTGPQAQAAAVRVRVRIAKAWPRILQGLKVSCGPILLH